MTEHEIAVELIRWCKYHYKIYPFLKEFYHIRNEGKPGQHSSEGLRAGIPDYCLPVARGGYVGFYLELKSHNKKPTKIQRETMEALRKHRHAVWWVDSLSKAIERLKWYCDMRPSTICKSDGVCQCKDGK